MIYKIKESISIVGSDNDRQYHIPGRSGGGYITLCGWVDVPSESHDPKKHPVTCSACKGIVAYCKKL